MNDGVQIFRKICRFFGTQCKHFCQLQTNHLKAVEKNLTCLGNLFLPSVVKNFERQVQVLELLHLLYPNRLHRCGGFLHKLRVKVVSLLEQIIMSVHGTKAHPSCIFIRCVGWFAEYVL